MLPTPNRTTITIWSIPARGRRSALPRPSSRPSALILWMHHTVAYAPIIFGVGVHRHRLHHDRLVARRHLRSRGRARPHPRGADLAPLRHDPVHRLGGDVLRRLVLGLFQHRAVPRRAQGRGADRLHRRRVAAEGHRDLRSLASAAAQHADPAHLGHHRDLGASRAARERPQGTDLGPRLHHRARPHASPACRPANTRTPRSTIRATSTAPRSSWRPASTAPMSSSARSS